MVGFVVFGWFCIAVTVFRLAFLLLRLLASIFCRIVDGVQAYREDRAALALFRYRLRQAQAVGMDAVSTEGLWR